MKVHFLSRDNQKDHVFDDQVQPYDSGDKQRFILCEQLNSQIEIFYGPRNSLSCQNLQVGSQS